LRLDFPTVLVTDILNQNIARACHLTHTCYVHRLFILVYSSISKILGENSTRKIIQLLSMYFLFSFPLLLHLNIFLSTLFSGTLNVCSFSYMIKIYPKSTQLTEKLSNKLNN